MSVHADNLKMTFPIAAAMLSIAWGAISLPANEAVNERVYAELQWGADYLTACLIANDTFVCQVPCRPCLASPSKCFYAPSVSSIHIQAGVCPSTYSDKGFQRLYLIFP